MTGSLPVVVCGDRNVLWGMAVAVRSALEQASGKLHVIVIGRGLCREDVSSLRASWDHHNLAAVDFHELDERRLSRFRSTAYLKSKAAYARYYLEAFVPNTRRCIYLDTDLIVMRDLCELGSLDMRGKTIAAVRDIMIRVAPTEDIRLAKIRELGRRLQLEKPEDYFNSGLLLIDLPRWRALHAQDHLVRVSMERFDTLHCQDQDALNIVFNDDVCLLDLSWNTSQYETDGSFASGVLHLIGTVKPWHHDYDFHYGPLFYRLLDRTGYRGRRPVPQGSLAAYREKLLRALPTRDMIAGKLRRSLRGKNAASLEPVRRGAS
jgi:lipopolysaccharide biosynthesis glycosyltransferase